MQEKTGLDYIHLLKATLDSTIDMIQVLKAVRNEQGMITDFVYVLNNQAAELFFGDKLHQIREEDFETCKRVVETGETIQHEFYRSANWYHQTFVKVDDGVSITAHNITSEHRYLTLFNNMIQGFCIIEVIFDANGKGIDYIFLEANPVFETQTGLKNAIGRRMSDLQPAHETYWYEVYGEVLRTRKSVHFENEASALKGGIWYDVFAFPYGEACSNQVAVFFNDITDRKRQQLRQEFLLSLADSLRTLSDPLAIQTVASEQIAQLLNTTHAFYAAINGNFTIQAEYAKAGAPSLMGEYSTAASASILPFLQQGAALVKEDLGKYPIPVAAIIAVPLVKNGILTGAFCVADQTPRAWGASEVELVREAGERIWAATERARAEQALAKSEALLTSVFLVSPVGLGFTDIEGNFLLLNDEMRRFLPTAKMPSLDNERQSRWLAFHPDGSRIAQHDFPTFRALRGDPVKPYLELMYTDDDGIHTWTRVASTPLLNEKGAITGAVSVVTDINALKETEKQLKELLQQKDIFISIASHELKTPITSMKVYADLIEERLAELGLEEEGILLKRLNNQIDKLTTLINHLLDTSRISEGELRLHPEKTDITDLLKEKVTEMQLTTTHQFLLEAPPLPVVMIDRERISQVITNLFTNAIRYSAKGSTITINGKSTSHGIEISIRDEGCGITQEDQQKIFERFFRGTSGSKESYPGMGLGLYITAQIIQRHNGQIRVESTPGKGSTSYFTLPAYTAS